MSFNSLCESMFANTLSFRKRVVITLLSEALAVAIVLITSFVLRHAPSLRGDVLGTWFTSVIAAVIVLCLGIAISIGEK